MEFCGYLYHFTTNSLSSIYLSFLFAILEFFSLGSAFIRRRCLLIILLPAINRGRLLFEDGVQSNQYGTPDIVEINVNIDNIDGWIKANLAT